MNSEGVKQFFRDWGTACLLLLVALLMLGVYAEIRRVGRQEAAVLDAKLRIAGDRESIAETRKKVTAMESRLLTNNVPDRLDRIETSIVEGVKQNREDLVRSKEESQALAEQQKKVADVLQQELGIPKEEIQGQDGMPLPEGRPDVRP